jgi:colanic acid biosynthesis glycosyl transferase WcaI
MADRLLTTGARSSQLAVIDHFADSREITLRPKLPSALRAELGLHDEFVVCYAGNHGRGHDFDTIVQALEVQAQADLTVPPLHWLFVGDGDEKARLWARIPSKMQPYVHALPPQARSKLGEVLAAGDVGLISVKAEMQGLLAPSKLYGLLAAGRPLAYIGPDRGRIPALLRQYDLGVAVRNGDGVGLFAGLVAIQQDPARWQRMSQLARQLAETRFDRPLAMAAHARVLESVLREGACERSG